MNIEKLINSNNWGKIYEKLTKNKLSPTQELSNGNTILHIASINNNKKIISYYLKKDISPLLKSNNDGNTPIHLLATYNYVTLLKQCVNNYPEFLNLLNNNDETITNILYNNLDFIKFVCKLIDDNKQYDTNLITNDTANNNIITKNIDDNTKINDNNYKIISILLKNQAKYINECSGSFLCYALNNDKLDIAKLLIDNKYDINKKDSYITPFIYAIENKQHEILKLLLKNKNIDIQYCGPEGDDNPMMIAIDNNDEYVINLLLEHKFNVDLFNRHLDTSLNYALKNKKLSVDILAKLILSGNLNIQNVDGETPLHNLCKYHNLDNYSNLLVNKELDIFIKDNHNKRPLDYLSGHTINKLIKFATKSYNTQLNDSSILKKTIKNDYELKKYMFATERSIPKSKDKKKLNEKFISGNSVTHGLFNADALHNMIYTVIMLKKYDNLCIPFQYMISDKYVNTKVSWNNLYNIPSENIIYELAQVYNNYFFEIQPYLIIWKNKNVNYIHKDFKFLIKKCLISEKVRYIFIKLTLVPSMNNTHANILVYDKVTNILERFEPYGLIPYLDGDNLNKFIENIGKECINKNLTYIKPIDMKNVIGPQVISDDSNYNIKKLGDPNGYCLAWTFWFLETRVSNPDTNTKDLLENMISNVIKPNSVDGDKLFIDFIRNYAGGLDKLKNEFMINAGIGEQNIYNLSLNDKDFNKILKQLKYEFALLVHKKIDI
jgi:ankyrin repeat protein